MAEYICELPVEGMVSFVSGNTTIPVYERIARCRDCKWFDFDICACKRSPLHMAVEPDGFCAWGERKEDA